MGETKTWASQDARARSPQAAARQGNSSHVPGVGYRATNSGLRGKTGNEKAAAKKPRAKRELIAPRGDKRSISRAAGEMGDIGTGSFIHETAPDLSKGMTTPDQARHFVEATGADILAPAVGNMHGMVQSMMQGRPRNLDIERIAEIKRATGSLLTLHGGSGTEIMISSEQSMPASSSFTSIPNFEWHGVIASMKRFRTSLTSSSLQGLAGRGRGRVYIKSALMLGTARVIAQRSGATGSGTGLLGLARYCPVCEGLNGLRNLRSMRLRSKQRSLKL